MKAKTFKLHEWRLSTGRQTTFKKEKKQKKSSKDPFRMLFVATPLPERLMSQDYQNQMDVWERGKQYSA